MIKSISPPPPDAAEAAAEADGATEFSTLHPDIIASHILRRLDGATLASAASCSSTLRHHSSQHHLWTEICHSTWPSTRTPHISHVIRAWPEGGPRAFFSRAFPLPTNAPKLNRSLLEAQPAKLISAVDIHYGDYLIFSKHLETETLSAWFRCSPLRIDLLEPKDVVPTPIRHDDSACDNIVRNMTLSWILMDPMGRRAVNLSSHEPISAQRHWLTREVKVNFSSILGSKNGRVQCSIMVTLCMSEAGEMQMREVTLEVEDMDGIHLKGKDSLGILLGAMVGPKGRGRKRVEQGRLRYEEYLERKKERGDRRVRREEALDLCCLAFGAFIFVVFLIVFLSQ